MAKCADKYFEGDSFRIVENGFQPEYARVAESVFSLANGYMGSRGCFEEGYSGEKLVGNYFNGIYERNRQDGPHYKGVTDVTEFMVNAVDWLFVRIEADGERLDLATRTYRDFQRVLDLKNGVLTRSFIWVTRSGKEIALSFERFLSMEKTDMGAQKITMKSLKSDVKLKVLAGMDFSIIHQSSGKNYWNCSDRIQEQDFLAIQGTTVETDQSIYSGCVFEGDYHSWEYGAEEEKKVSLVFNFELAEGEEKSLIRIARNIIRKEQGEEAEKAFAEKKACGKKELSTIKYDTLKEENSKWWEKAWEQSDIVIQGDEDNQQGIRFCIFQMYQTYHKEVKGGNIGAKGLTGEAYNGNAFWDTETYCLPFYIFNDLEAAKNLLMFRYETLEEAKKRARDLDCDGAFYPIATISGKECCNLWQHASLQLQASTAVAYGIWMYEKITKDISFVYEYGMEMLIEVSRMLATRGAYNADGTRYGYYCVMGPDEFQMMVNNNCYTNLMAKFTFHYTESMLKKMEQEQPEAYQALASKLKLKEEERSTWAKMERLMYIPYDEKTMLYEQHEGYYQLPHVDVDAIPVEDFPLYDHWAYDRIYRNDMIKQPDVLMFQLLFNSSFTEEQLRANYDYYEPRCIHESSLSPSVHSILASQLKKKGEAYGFFGFATRMDLDNYNRNSGDGLHTTSIAAAWMNIVYGFGGMRSDGAMLAFSPTIPKQWEGYSFRIRYQDAVILVEVKQNKVAIHTLEESEIQVLLYGETITLGKEGVQVEIPKNWR